MTLTALGAYVNLLCIAWDSDPIATLPSDSEKLRRLAGASVEEWTGIKDEVLENFNPFENDSTRIVNNRLRQQWQELNDYHEKLSHTASERGKKGAEKRWTKKDTITAEPAGLNTAGPKPEDEDVDIAEDEV